MNRFAAYSVIALAYLVGGGSLLVFAAFLLTGPFTIIRFDASEAQGLLWDAFLSALFFIQHSGMVRPSFRTWLAIAIPPHYHPATYAIASGTALITVVLLWQTSQTVLLEVQGPLQQIGKSIPAQFRIAEPTGRERVWTMFRTAHNRPYVHSGFLLPGR